MDDSTLTALLEKKFSGEALSESVVIGESIGGLYRPSKQSVYFHKVKNNSKATLSLLEIGAIFDKQESVKWRIWFDGISVSKQFKPNFILPIGENTYGATVIDITPLVNREAKRRFHKLTVISSTPVFLTHATIIKLIEDNSDTTNWIKYYTGGAIIKSQEIKKISVKSNELRQNNIHFNIFAQKVPQYLEIRVNERYVKRLEISKNCDDYQIPFDKEPILTLSFKNDGIDVGGKSQSFILITNLIVNSASKKQRSIDLEAEIRGRNESGVIVNVDVFNNSESPLEAPMLVAFSSGILVSKIDLESIQPKSSAKRELVLKLPPNSSSITLRLIWKENSEPQYIEKKIKITNQI
ncbi:hypothetical protein [Fervidicoccus sp.]|uniref:hypothetical protein n=1 Tax=Fervidicoccus sp. TaxID=2060324 RepID=UPI003D11F795